ncbi:MAG: polysaccharide biosynthesis tyrosine autokinase [Xenococcaceae cyanobacterium MO_188.B29]|nr:polysaccharide biosynthesis tyrosine autokinase [Xenococcaceae cyanobacterium MO_188.B29]
MTPPIVKRFLISFEQHKLLGLFIFLLSLGVSGIFALQPEPPTPEATYKASGQLSYSNPPPLFTTTGEQLQEQGRLINVDILLGPNVQEKIRNQLGLNSQQIQRRIERNLNIKVPQPGETALITLDYNNAQTPEEAVRTLGVFMREMVEQSRLINTSQLRGRIEALEQRLGEVQRDLAAAEETFYRFISKEGTPLLAIQDGSLFAGITGSQQQQRQLTLILEEINGQISSLVDQLGLNPEEAYISAALSADPILANLRAQMLQNETEIKLRQKELRPEHPAMVALRKQQANNEQLFAERAEEVIGGSGQLKPLRGQPTSQLRQDSSLDPARQQLANTLVTLQTQREGIQRQLESVQSTEQELREQYEQFPDQQLQQARLVQEVETKRALYQTILTALVDAQSAEAETTGSYAIAQAPVVQEVLPTRFAVTNRFLILAGGAGIGLVAAAGTIFLLATLDDRLHTPQELRELFSDREVPVLGKLPYVVCFNFNGQETPILVDNDSSYLAYYERVRSNIRRFASKSAKVISITSVSAEEGKSVTAFNLAIASAHAGKRTLLIELDLRSPSNTDAMQVEPDPEASTEPLNYYAERNEAIRLVPGVANLYVVPTPGPLRQVVAILESDELRKLIEDARGRFDLIIIDTPSLSKCNDALLIESLTDGMILVTRPGITRGSMLGETVDQFTETDISLLGAIINDVDQVITMSDLESSGLLDKEAEAENQTLGSQL